jgi:hypothetical protein
MPDFVQNTRLRPKYRQRLRGVAFVAVGLLAVGGTVAACGSSPSTPSAARSSTTTTNAKTTTTNADSSTSGTQGSGLLAYSSCMRSHGVPNFPDPASSGGIPKPAAVSALQAVSNAQAQAAETTCQHFAAGESLAGQKIQTITTQEQQDYLKAATCMRSHGITTFPEPVFSNGQVEFPMLQHLVDLNSPQFKEAYDICKKDIPPGLPGNGAPVP